MFGGLAFYGCLAVVWGFGFVVYEFFVLVCFRVCRVLTMLRFRFCLMSCLGVRFSADRLLSF